MIKYDRLWVTLKEKNISQYKLIKDYGIDKAQLHRLRKNMVVKTIILNNLCRILNCNVEDIMEYVPDEEFIESQEQKTGKENATTILPDNGYKLPDTNSSNADTVIYEKKRDITKSD